jgi:hypothetical protein
VAVLVSSDIAYSIILFPSSAKDFFIVTILLVENPDTFEYIIKSTLTYVLSLKKRTCLGKRGHTVTLPIFVQWYADVTPY